MKFRPLYPRDDKANLIVDKLDNQSVKLTFEVIPEYVGSLIVTLSTTIWWAHSWGERIHPQVKKHLNKIVKIADDGVLSREDDKTLKIVQSSWSDDITIANRFHEPMEWEGLQNVEFVLNNKNCNPEILKELFEILSIENE